ncbi:SRA stem-loop-interacting RNA-binding protein, mitochondrial-like [Anneissia japonica]|uniref:SRA stem-loop-interacting RNA-binding protein, mitochondrial-like n=1 Tax=Anneissia japonica TaxID=1529436 RepID=UPI00142577F6|nr:SRA stem-loop-interacting RNA-binding protein, mitochondrial-like [Anneissia japonica]
MASGRQAAKKACEIFVARLPWTVGPCELRSYFSEFGNVKQVNVPFDIKTGFSRGFGLVQFETVQEMKTAVQQEVHIVEGRRVQVQQSGMPTKPERLQINGNFIG